MYRYQPLKSIRVHLAAGSVEVKTVYITARSNAHVSNICGRAQCARGVLRSVYAHWRISFFFVIFVLLCVCVHLCFPCFSLYCLAFFFFPFFSFWFLGPFLLLYFSVIVCLYVKKKKKKDITAFRRSKTRRVLCL